MKKKRLHTKKKHFYTKKNAEMSTGVLIPGIFTYHLRCRCAASLYHSVSLCLRCLHKRKMHKKQRRKGGNMGKEVIIACDFSSKGDVMKFLSKFSGESLFLKIGMELFYSEGPEIIKEIKKQGHKVFLDLKLHDIPNTVMKTMRVLSDLDIDMCNVHASGTISMMEAAVKGLTREDGTRPLLIAVTQLTSTSEERMNRDLLINETMDKVVMHYASNAKEAGLDGVVCSPLEAEKVHASCGKQFLTITPGIRFATDDPGDQARVMTPAQAKEMGSDYIVVGRPITAADDVVWAYQKCVEEFIG